ncbi:uncharacterized protein TNCV_3320251 [Trichonephila clavipes]|nr:uncharacterized protein TNCV_3320251 [Trichonephila clavipes]
MSSIPVPLKTRRVKLSRAETSSRWCGVVVRRGGASSGVVHVTWFKITWSVAKSPRVAEQCDVNINSTQLNPRNVPWGRFSQNLFCSGFLLVERNILTNFQVCSFKIVHKQEY